MGLRKDKGGFARDQGRLFRSAITRPTDKLREICELRWNQRAWIYQDRCSEPSLDPPGAVYGDRTRVGLWSRDQGRLAKDKGGFELRSAMVGATDKLRMI